MTQQFRGGLANPAESLPTTAVRFDGGQRERQQQLQSRMYKRVLDNIQTNYVCTYLHR
jgi:hypothetical protein